MNAWWLLFTIAMLISPIVFALAVRPADDPDADPATAQRKLFVLALSTIGAIGITLIVWRTLGVRPAVYTWPMFFPLFFFLAMPVMRAKNPAWGAPHNAQPAVRTASLAGDRAHTSPVPKWVWALAWALCIAGFIAIAIRPLTVDVRSSEIAKPFWIRWLVAMLITLIVTPTLLLTLPLGIRAAMREPEPMDAERTPELADAYADLRNTKAWFFAGLFMTMQFAVIAAMIGIVYINSDSLNRVMAWGGAIGGSLIGVAGAAGGIYIDRRRVRVNTILRKLEHHQQATTA